MTVMTISKGIERIEMEAHHHHDGEGHHDEEDHHDTITMRKAITMKKANQELLWILISG